MARPYSMLLRFTCLSRWHIHAVFRFVLSSIKPFAALSFFCCLTLGLSGCGFEWRGSQQATAVLPSSLKHMQVVSAKPYHHFARALAYRLRSAGVRPAKNGPVLRILSDQRSYTTQSLSYNVESRIYTFIYQVKFQIDTAPIETLSTERRLVVRRNEALESTDQVRLITEEMQDDLAQQLVNRLAHPSKQGY